MSLVNNFIAVIVATATSFTSSITDAPMVSPMEIKQNATQDGVDAAVVQANNNSFISGMAVIDRAKNNSMSTSGSTAHIPIPLQSMGRLPIVLYAVMTDKEVAKGNVSKIVSMTQGSSGAATDEMWEKYGGKEIITDLSNRYNLQETIVGKSWADTKMSAVDMARLLRRFLDDDKISTREKKWTVSLLRNTALTVSGEDFSWGIPTAMGKNEESGEESESDSTKDSLAWMQGWSGSGSDPMIRSSAAIIGDDMRYVAIVHSLVPSGSDDANANSVATEISQALVNGFINDGSKEGESEENADSDVEKFRESQLSQYKTFVDPDYEEPETTTKSKPKPKNKKKTNSSSQKTHKKTREKTWKKD